jgi:hypothetical protein
MITAHHVVNSRNIASLQRLSEDSAKLNDQKKINLSWAFLEHNLMVTPIWLTGLMIFGKVKTQEAFCSTMGTMGSANSLWESFQDHLVNGKDTEDRDSVGGYSAREIIIMCDLLTEAGYLPSEDVIQMAILNGYYTGSAEDLASFASGTE